LNNQEKNALVAKPKLSTSILDRTLISEKAKTCYNLSPWVVPKAYSYID